MVNGGSAVLVTNDLDVTPKRLGLAQEGHCGLQGGRQAVPRRASRGNAQDIHMRGAFAKQGIDVNKDVQFINIPNPSDHLQALRRGEVELISTVEPFATQILQAKAAKLFGYPYDQAAGKLTNIVLTRSDVVASNPKGLQETVRAIVKVDEFIASDKAAWVDVISKVTGLDKGVATGAIENLDPDPKMYRASALAIAATDARPQIYQFRCLGRRRQEHGLSVSGGGDGQAQDRTRLLGRVVGALSTLRRFDRYLVPVAILIGWELFSRSGALPGGVASGAVGCGQGMGRLGVPYRRQHPDLQRQLDL